MGTDQLGTTSQPGALSPEEQIVFDSLDPYMSPSSRSVLYALLSVGAISKESHGKITLALAKSVTSSDEIEFQERTTQESAAQIERARRLIEKVNYFEMERLFVREKPPLSPLSWELMAKAISESGNVPMMIRVIEAIISSGCTTVWGFSMIDGLATAIANQSNPQQLLQVFKRTENYILGLALAEKGDSAQCLDALKTLTPDHRDVLNRLVAKVLSDEEGKALLVDALRDNKVKSRGNLFKVLFTSNPLIFEDVFIQTGLKPDDADLNPIERKFLEIRMKLKENMSPTES